MPEANAITCERIDKPLLLSSNRPDNTQHTLCDHRNVGYPLLNTSNDFMLKRFLRRWLPPAQHLQRERSLRFFGRLLYNPDLWRLDLTSVATAVSIGLFMAFMPIPLQMVAAAGASIALGCNLPIAVVLCWISNPLTLPIFLFASYRIGSWVLALEPQPFVFELSLAWIKTTFADLWAPLTIGCFVLGIVSALLGNLFVRLLWGLQMLRVRKRRRRRGGYLR